MAPPVSINYLAVLVATIAGMVLGFLWYGPLFGKTWMKLMGFTKESMERMKSSATKGYIFMFIGSFIMYFVLAHFIDYTQAKTTSDAVQAGFWIWLGFIAPILLGSVLWENKPFKLYILNVIHYLVALIIAAIIITLWV